jgi:hypothetical protein
VGAGRGGRGGRLGAVRLRHLARREPLVKDLKTTTARALYDHNSTRSIWFYMYAAAKGTLFAALLPGQDDEVVAYHSAGGTAGATGTTLGNPTDSSPTT